VFRLLAKAVPRRTRPVPKQRALFAEAAQLEKRMMAQLASELRALQDDVSLSSMARHLQLAQTNAVVSLVDDAGARATFVELEPLLEDGIKAAAKITAGGDAVAFDAVQPKIKIWLKEHTAKLVKETTKTTREAIRSMVERGVDSGRHPMRLAKDIKSVIGLDERSAIAVDRRREYLLRKLDDPTRANKLADKYADKLLTRRAENIARTEALRSISHGQKALWEQLQEEGALGAKAMREWDSSGDSAVCEICEPMNGTRIAIGAQWRLPDGTMVDVPNESHPSCRCVEILVI